MIMVVVVGTTGLVEEVEEAGMVGSPMVVERDGEAEKGLWEFSVFTLLGVGS